MPGGSASSWFPMDKIGDALGAQGELPKALEAFRESLAIAERLAKADPTNAGRQRDLSVAYEKVGNVLKEQKNWPEALKAYLDSFAIRERLVKADPGNAVWQRDLSLSNERLGEVLMKDGKTAEAVAAFERALGIYDMLIGRFGDPQARANSVTSLAALGLLKGKDGIQNLRSALAILIELRDANRLDERRLKLIPVIEAQIAALEVTSPYDKVKATIKVVFEAGNFAKAAALQTELAAAVEKIETGKDGKAAEAFTALRSPAGRECDALAASARPRPDARRGHALENQG